MEEMMRNLGFEKFLSDPSLWAMVGVFAVPHILYAYVWLGTKSFVEHCKEFKMHPCDVIAQLGIWIKVWQYFTCFMWYIQNGPMFSIWNVSLLSLAGAAVLIGLGQTLNFAVYKKLGKDGVYYGYKLGRPVPWVSGFPFVIRDPQYTGCVLSLWGVFLLLSTPAHIQAGMLPLMCCWTLCYVFSSIVEGNF